MISCRNVATLLMSDSLAAQPWWKRMEVRLHLAMCRLCSRLARQLEQMGSHVRQISKQDVDGKPFEERLLQRLSEK